MIWKSFDAIAKQVPRTPLASSLVRCRGEETVTGSTRTAWGARLAKSLAFRHFSGRRVLAPCGLNHPYSRR